MSGATVKDGIHLAASEAEKEAVYRLRYDVYVREMGRYGTSADHAKRRLCEPEDETGRIYYAAEGGRVIATHRMSWGGDGPFTARLVEQYQLAPFLAEIAPEHIAVGERAMVVPELRGSPLFRELQQASHSLIRDNRVELVFGCCEPHLLSLYVGQGCRTYSKKNIQGKETGFLIPLVTVVEDIEYLRRIGSPSAATSKDWGADARIPACVDRLVVNGGNVISQRLTASGAYWLEIHNALERLDGARVGAFDGLSEEQAQHCLGKSNIIACTAGERVLKQGNVARNMFVVLDGNLEAREGETLVRIFSPGDVFGEMAFLLEQPRAADVYAATDARILSLSEATLRALIASNPDVAAQLLLNVSKMLCRRILNG